MSKYIVNNKSSREVLDPIVLNQYTFNRYFLWIKDLAVSLFEWENLPDGCDSRFLETILFEQGRILFFEDKIIDKFLNLPFTNQSNLDVYGYPISRRAYAINGYNKSLDNTNSVIIYNNSIKKGDSDVAQYYAQQIYEIKRSIDTNVKTQKFPFLITCPQNQIQTMKNLYNKVMNNEPLIFASDKLNEFNNMEVIQTNAPFIADKLYDLYDSVMSEVCEFFGINKSQEKVERMITSEVATGIGMTEANRQIRLKMRRDACKQINEMFGLNVSVKFRDDIEMMEALMQYQDWDSNESNFDNKLQEEVDLDE